MKILILGFGRSGKAVYERIKNDHEVMIYDERKIEGVNYFDFKRLRKEMPLFDLTIRSPGIPCNSKIYMLAKVLSKKVISEVEYALPFYQDHFLIGVTGSNGKTTTVEMISAILSKKYHVLKVGNIGMTLTEGIPLLRKESIIVMELSSFQLEDTSSLNLDIAVVVNLSKNHLDKVPFIGYYYASKKRILLNCKKVYLDRTARKRFKKVKARKIEYLEAPYIKELTTFNQEHFNVAYTIGKELGVEENVMIDTIHQFKLAKYRNEWIKETNQFIYINDSKSTNIDSTNACLSQHINYPRIIILGGIAKSGTFKKIAKNKDDIIIAYGRDSLKIFKETADLYFADLKAVIRFVNQNYHRKKYIIFSPACSSLDQFSSYMERGEYFNQLIS